MKSEAIILILIKIMKVGVTASNNAYQTAHNNSNQGSQYKSMMGITPQKHQESPIIQQSQESNEGGAAAK